LDEYGKVQCVGRNRAVCICSEEMTGATGNEFAQILRGEFRVSRGVVVCCNKIIAQETGTRWGYD